MRHFKFRLWDKEEKRIINLSKGYPYHHTFSVEEGGNISYYNLQNGSGGKEYELMQYTGLQDENGVEVYEGDIFSAEGHFQGEGWFDTGEHDYDFNAPVEWDNKHLSYTCGGYYLHELYNFKIIGNIYENPELLKDDSNDI